MIATQRMTAPSETRDIAWAASQLRSGQTDPAPLAAPLSTGSAQILSIGIVMTGRQLRARRFTVGPEFSILEKLRILCHNLLH